MQLLLPDDRDRILLLSYMAAVVQYKGVKFQWAPLVQGIQGNGKTLLSRCLTEAVGKHHVHPASAAQIANKFNYWMQDKILITVEDVYVPHDKAGVMEALKPMITDSELEIERKGQDQVRRRICANMFLSTNHKGALKLEEGDRRFAPFFTAQQTVLDLIRDGMTNGYFYRLYGWLANGGYAIVTHYLQHYKIDDEFNPALGGRAPRTTSTMDAITQSLGRVEQEILNAIDEERLGFKGGWVSSHYLNALIRDVGAERMIARNRLRPMMMSLGYDYHPAMGERGRANNVVAPEGIQSYLYFKMSKVGMHEGLSHAAVCEMYSRAQMPTVATGGG